MKLKLPKFILEFTGHLYLHKYPMWIVYRPNMHKVRGKAVRKILQQLEPGDILLRRYDQYLNTICTPGFWSHSGIYIGDDDVVHSVSEGCIREDILNFCRADAVCILRLKQPCEQAVQKAKLLAAMHPEYDYDFNPLNESYYCTEAVDMVCDHIYKDDYTMVAGNSVLTPDGMYRSKESFLVFEVNAERIKRRV